MTKRSPEPEQQPESNLDIFVETNKKYFHEREKVLESSHRELKEKLAKVKEEINQISEKKASISSEKGLLSPEWIPKSTQKFSVSADEARQQFE